MDGMLNRRQFLQSAAGAAAACALGPVAAARTISPKPEELVASLFGSLSAEQRKVVALPWEDERRTQIGDNWAIVEPAIQDFYTADQQQLVRDIFKGVVSGESHDRFQKQMKDDYGGFGSYHCCVFGEPGRGKYEWVMTGRHLTIRCDGGSTGGTAFGGPIFYGHAMEFNEKPDHPGNVWWHQSKLANKVYVSLDGRQREKALLEGQPPDEPEVTVLRGEKGPFDGIAAGELSKDQKALVAEVMKELLAPYRASDVEQAMAFIEKGGGLDKVHLSFYKEGDLGDDGIWDCWMLQGPTLSWYFRGSPHAHVWVRIADPA
jgi:hypothetical protein